MILTHNHVEKTEKSYSSYLEAAITLGAKLKTTPKSELTNNTLLEAIVTIEGNFKFHSKLVEDSIECFKDKFDCDTISNIVQTLCKSLGSSIQKKEASDAKTFMENMVTKSMKIQEAKRLSSDKDAINISKKNRAEDTTSSEPEQAVINSISSVIPLMDVVEPPKKVVKILNDSTDESEQKMSKPMNPEHFVTPLTSQLSLESPKYPALENVKNVSESENNHILVKKCAAAKFKVDKEGQVNAIIMNSTDSCQAINKFKLIGCQTVMLSRLDFSNFSISLKVFDNLIGILQQCSFKEISFHYINCNRSQLSRILDAIHTNKNITKIHLVNMQVESLSDWSEMLFDTAISKFIMRSCVIKSIQAFRWGDVFRLITDNHESLKTIGYIDCKLEDMCALDLKEALYKNSHIQTLDLSHNNITTKGYKEIRKGAEGKCRKALNEKKNLIVNGNPCHEQ